MVPFSWEIKYYICVCECNDLYYFVWYQSVCIRTNGRLIDKHNSDILLDDKMVKMCTMPMIMIVSSLSLRDKIKKK